MRISKSRAGFTLTEVLTTVAIITILIATVVPVVAQQTRKGEQARIVNDAVHLRTGIEAFINNVRRYPSTLTQLTTAVVAGVDTDLSGSTIPNNLAPRWAGPYVQRTVSATGISSGYGSTIQAALVSRQEDQRVVLAPAGQAFATLVFVNVPFDRCREVNDEVDGTTPAAPDSDARGIIHCVTGDILYFLAVPIQ